MIRGDKFSSSYTYKREYNYKDTKHKERVDVVKIMQLCKEHPPIDILAGSIRNRIDERELFKLIATAYNKHKKNTRRFIDGITLVYYSCKKKGEMFILTPRQYDLLLHS